MAGRLEGRCTVLSSVAPEAVGYPGPVPWLQLARDDRPMPAADPTAGGALHWAPIGHDGMRARSGALARWIEDSGCRLLVADVSVEVVLLARLLSAIPVAVALRGNRTDRAHALGYDVAEHILAPWSEHTQHEWPQRWIAKTAWVGPIGRYDGRRVVVDDACPLPGRCVLLLLGAGGHSLTDAALAEAAAVPGTHWHLAGPAPAGAAGRDGSHPVRSLGWVDDVWPHLCRADVVVAGAGDNAVAEVAAAGRPMVAVAQPRPYDEQAHQAAVLARHELAEVVSAWPDRRGWARVLDAAEERGGHGWRTYTDGQGADRAAALLSRWATGLTTGIFGAAPPVTAA